MGKFIVFPDVSEEHRWRLVSANGQITGASAEGYTRKEDAERGIRTHVHNVYAAIGGTGDEAEVAAVDKAMDDGLVVEYEGYTEDGEIDLSYIKEHAPETEPTPEDEAAKLKAEEEDAAGAGTGVEDEAPAA